MTDTDFSCYDDLAQCYIEGVDYLWKRGIREQLTAESAGNA